MASGFPRSHIKMSFQIQCNNITRYTVGMSRVTNKKVSQVFSLTNRLVVKKFRENLLKNNVGIRGEVYFLYKRLVKTYPSQASYIEGKIKTFFDFFLFSYLRAKNVGRRYPPYRLEQNLECLFGFGLQPQKLNEKQNTFLKLFQVQFEMS